MVGKELELRRHPGAHRSRYALAGIGVFLLVYAVSDHPFYGGIPGFGATQWTIAICGGGLLACSLLPIEVVGKVLLASTSVLAMLGLTELLAELTLGPQFRPNFRYDENLIFEFIPSRTSVMTLNPVNGGQRIRHSINSDGFRGPELLTDKPMHRVVVYGDSFIHAPYTARHNTFAARFGDELANQLGIETEVVNAGISSYGPDQIAVKMRKELPILDPDLVIVAVYAGNDYGDLMRNKLFRLDREGRLEPNDWTLAENQRLAFDLSQRTSILKRIGGVLADGILSPSNESAANAIDLEWLLANSEQEYRTYIVDSNSTITNTHVDYYNANISLAPDNPSSRYAIALMREVIRSIRDIAKENGTPLALLIIPHATDVTDQYDNWKLDEQTYPGYKPSNQVAPLEQIADSLGVIAINLYDTFRSRDANLLYFHGGDDHWNDEGQALAAATSVATLAPFGMLMRSTPELDGTAR